MPPYEIAPFEAAMADLQSTEDFERVMELARPFYEDELDEAVATYSVAELVTAFATNLDTASTLLGDTEPSPTRSRIAVALAGANQVAQVLAAKAERAEWS